MNSAPSHVAEIDTSDAASTLQESCANGTVRSSTELRTEDNSRTRNELAEICNHEVALLENRWVQIGQFQKPPKRLIQNVKALSERTGSPDLQVKDAIVDDVKQLFKRIRGALRVISIAHGDPNGIPHGYGGLAKKASVFLKRLSHDTAFAQSVQGAKQFRRYEKSVKKQQKLLEPIYGPEEHDLGDGWLVKKIECQQDLINAGRVLQLCVGDRKGMGKSYFRDFVEQRSTFWLVSSQSESKYLLELYAKKRTRVGPKMKGMLNIGEFNGRDHQDPELPRAVAQQLSKCLRANPASSEALMNAGVFPAFNLGTKDIDEPDVFVNVEEFTYEAWLTHQDIVVSRYLTNEGSDSDSHVWGYFRNDHVTRRGRRKRKYAMDFDYESESPIGEYPWETHILTEIGEDELNIVMIHFQCEISNTESH